MTVGYDLVIRNGTVVDGSGLDAYRSDVGVVGDRIATVGRITERGAHEVDAEGHVVTPGFIDGHTHMDAQIFWDPHGTFSCHHGVTTVVMGNCGFTLAPASAEQAALVVRNLERAEDISPEAMAAGIEWGWTTFAEHLDVLDALPKGIKYAAQIGHSALRTYSMGERAFTEAATAEDLAAMDTELRSALRAGAYGFTTSRTVHHQTSDDRPVASRIATLDELTALVETVGDVGAGMFQMVSDPPSPDEAERYQHWLRDLAARTGVTFAMGATGGARGVQALAQIDDIAAAGGRVFGVTHPRGIGTLSSFRSQLPFDQLAVWQEFRALPEDEQKRRLRDPDERARLVKAATDGPYVQRFGGEARPPDFDLMRVLDRAVPPNPTVREAAAARGVDPVELMIDLALEHDYDIFFSQPMAPFDHDAVRTLLTHPRTVVGFSDAGAHVSQMSDCSIQTHVLAYWVRDTQELTLEAAVQKMTLAPARAWGFHDRGLVREGMVADLNVFDPDTVAPELPSLVHDLPGGAPRLRQVSTGIRATVVSGEVTLADGVHTGALPGRLVRNRLAG
ncbi:MAG: amidohydrolase family protein [Acidimicrobiales bacterium]|nr:amidohydrolase family protein [Acidimicrobiales bacterium]